MSEIRKVAILGAGALGAFYASKFLSMPQFITTLIATGQRAVKLKENGLTVNGKHFPITTVGPTKECAPVDLIIVALKHHQLATAAPDLHELIGSNTIILSVMNGLDSEEILGRMFGMEKLLYCVVAGIEAVRQDGKVTVTTPGRFYFGEAINRQITDRVNRVKRALDLANIPTEIPEDMIRILWWKFMINVGVNQASAVLRAPYSVFQQSADARLVIKVLMQEVIALAKVTQVNLGESDLEDLESLLITASPQGKTSMLQDLEAGRKTEIDMFAGKILELGSKYCVPTPMNFMIFHLIHALEMHVSHK